MISSACTCSVKHHRSCLTVEGVNARFTDFQRSTDARMTGIEAIVARLSKEAATISMLEDQERRVNAEAATLVNEERHDRLKSCAEVKEDVARVREMCSVCLGGLLGCLFELLLTYKNHFEL